MSLVALEGRTFVLDPGDRPEVRMGTRRQRWLVRKAWGSRRIAMKFITFDVGMSPVQRRIASEEVWFVFSGAGTVFIDGHAYAVEQECGVYLRPGVEAWVKNFGPDPMEVISVVCPEEEGHVDAIFDASVFGNAPSISPVIRLVDRPPQPTLDRFYQVLADTDIGTEQVTQFVGVIPPGRAPDHHHTYEEVITILDGKGFMWAGKTKTPVHRGSCIYLPAGQSHCLENTGDSPMRLMGVFYPSGSPANNYPDQ